MTTEVHQRGVRYRRWWRDIGRYVWRNYNWVPLTAFALFAFVIGIIGEYQWSRMQVVPARLPQTWFTSLDSTLGLFALSQSPADPMPIALAWARFLAPMAVAAAVINAMFLVLSSMSYRLRARAKREHLVIVGCGSTALSIALDAQASSINCVAIDLTETNNYAQEIREIGIPVISVVRDGEAEVEASLFRLALRGANVKSASEVVVVTGSDDTNARASRVISGFVSGGEDQCVEVNWRGVRVSGRSERPLPRIFVESTSLELAYWLQDSLPHLGGALNEEAPAQAQAARDLPSGNLIEWFSAKERGARDLLDRISTTGVSSRVAPGTMSDEIPPRLLIVGTSQTAAAVAVQYCRNWASNQQILGDKRRGLDELPVLIIVDDPYVAQPDERKFMDRVLAEWSQSSPVRDWPRCLVDPTTVLAGLDPHHAPDAVVVALESDVRSVGAARMVRQTFPSAPVWICCEDSLGISSYARPPFEKTMEVVSLTNLGLTIKRIRAGVGEDLARAMQGVDYVERHKAKQQPGAADPADRFWGELDEDAKEKNRAAVDGWRTALGKLQLIVVKNRPAGRQHSLTWLEKDLIAEHLHEAWRLVMDENDLWSKGRRVGISGEGFESGDPQSMEWRELPADLKFWSQNQSGLLERFLASFDYFIEESDWRSNYVERVGKSYYELIGPGSIEDTVVAWENTDEDTKEANRTSARASLVYLSRLKICVRSALEFNETSDDLVFDDDEVKYLAPQEHQRWMEQKLKDGWTLGSQKSKALRVHPDLRDWNDLTPDVRDKDLIRIKRIPDVIKRAGYELRRF